MQIFNNSVVIPKGIFPKNQLSAGLQSDLDQLMADLTTASQYSYCNYYTIEDDYSVRLFCRGKIDDIAVGDLSPSLLALVTSVKNQIDAL